MTYIIYFACDQNKKRTDSSGQPLELLDMNYFLDFFDFLAFFVFLAFLGFLGPHTPQPIFYPPSLEETLVEFISL